MTDAERHRTPREPCRECGRFTHTAECSQGPLAQYGVRPAVPTGAERGLCAACSLIGATYLDYINDPDTGVASRALYHEATGASNHTCGRSGIRRGAPIL